MKEKAGEDEWSSARTARQCCDRPADSSRAETSTAESGEWNNDTDKSSAVMVAPQAYMTSATGRASDEEGVVRVLDRQQQSMECTVGR